MSAASVGDRDGKEDEPDMPENLDFFTPARSHVEHEPAEHLQKSHDDHRDENRRHENFDGPIDCREYCFHVRTLRMRQQAGAATGDPLFGRRAFAANIIIPRIRPRGRSLH
jgi:hypothetical protein